MAQGFRTRAVQIALFLQSHPAGVAGWIAGFMGGSGAALLWELLGLSLARRRSRSRDQTLDFAVAMSVVACLLGTWIPTWVAIKTDVAIVLRQE